MAAMVAAACLAALLVLPSCLGLSVLWIGNSYTYYNDLPTMVARVAEAAGEALEFDSHTEVGSSSPGLPGRLVLGEARRLPAHHRQDPRQALGRGGAPGAGPCTCPQTPAGVQHPAGL